MSQTNTKPNRLIHETSPYLLQHAYNPVDWYPWGREALKRAKSEDKVILLSVGYSACHWCHVMERESFENEETAKLMNENFVCIKVDREERPDIDKVYQTAHQFLTQRAGGWPLTVFLTPDEHTPLYAGTYFPDQARHGMASFAMVLNRIAEHYQNVRSNIAEHNRVMKESFAKLNRLQATDRKISDEATLLSNAVQELSRQYDPVYGGFGRAPKFPHSTQVDLLLAYSCRESTNQQLQNRSLTIAFHTLDAMADVGLNDQVGGGFCRYSVDDRWEIPHFEKMLYDNALLLPLYVDAGFYPEQKHMHERAIQTAEWVLREMQSPFGGYFSSLDADSEGKEGKFYVWSLEELQRVLSAEEYKVIEIRFGLRGIPNFEGEWHLKVANTLHTVALRSGFSLDEVRSMLANARQKLFETRSDRIRPGLDDKILASWNGMMIKAMARAGRLLHRSDFVESAERALDFVRQYMWKNKRLLATAKNTRAHLNAYLDDHVFLVDGILELLNARWRDIDLAFALDLVDILLRHFQSEQGCFNFTSDDHETLLYRSIPTHDEATPSGNGIAVQILLKLAYLVGDARYERAANQIIRAMQAQVMNFPSSFGSLICGIEQRLFPATWVVIRGTQEDTLNWAQACAEMAPASTLVYPIPNDAQYLPGLLSEKKPQDGTVAFVCYATSCAPPCHSLEELLHQISMQPKFNNG